ncbi:MAG: hypothetical protein V9E87_00600 [Gemmatimonadales bacterium]
MSSSIALLLLIRFLVAREGGTFAAVGLRFTRASPVRMAAGLMLGMGIYAVTLLAITLAVGPLQLVRATAPPLDVVLVIVASTIALAAMEELAFRSYSLWTARSALGLLADAGGRRGRVRIAAPPLRLAPPDRRLRRRPQRGAVRRIRGHDARAGVAPRTPHRDQPRALADRGERGARILAPRRGGRRSNTARALVAMDR